LFQLLFTLQYLYFLSLSLHTFFFSFHFSLQVPNSGFFSVSLV
jgi:hypothetical protein